MNNSTSNSTGSSKAFQSISDQRKDNHVTLTEKVNLTKEQYEVLNIVCTTYEKSVSEYMRIALVEAMKSDIEEGNFCDALLEKLDGDDQKEEKGTHSSSPAFVGDDINTLQF